jgi:DNA-binding beta-propeller fold protein YncE
MPDGTPCGDADLCNGEESCRGGACLPPSTEEALACRNASLEAYVTDFQGNALSIIDLGPWWLTERVGRRRAVGVAADTVRGEVWVSERKPARCRVDAPVGGARYGAGRRVPLGIALDPSGERLYVATTNAIGWSSSTRARAVIGSIAVGSGPSGLALDATRGFCTCPPTPPTTST